MKHKRYYLFAGCIYYPLGGEEDLVNTFDTIKKAKKAYEKKNLIWDFTDDEWATIFDTKKMKTVRYRYKRKWVKYNPYE